MPRLFKKLMSCILTLAMICSAFFTQAGSVFAATTGTEYTVTPDTTSGEINYFTYSSSSPSWTVSGSEAYSDVYTTTESPENVYAEFTFVGNRVEIWGCKSPLHGIVNYYMDGNFVTSVDSYAASRSSATSLFQYGFDDGDKLHTVKIVATGTANASATATRAVIQFSYAKVWHSDYTATDFTLADSMRIYVGQTKQITPETVTPSYAEISGAQYQSSDTSVLTVTESGVIEGVKAGTAEVTVTLNGITRTVAVEVMEASPNLYGVITDTNTHYDSDSYEDISNMVKNQESLSAWKGDTAISQIVLISENSAIKNVAVQSSDFVSGSNTISASDIELSFIKETKAYIGDAGYNSSSDSPASTPSDDSEKTYVPDIIYSSDPVDMAFNSVKGIWVSVNVPRGAEVGEYTGTVTVTADGVDPLAFEYTLEVFDAVMPDADDYEFDIELWQYPYSIAEYYGVEPFSDEHIEILKTHMAQYRDLGGHAITCSIVDEAWAGQTYSANEIRYPSMVKWIKGTDGTFSYDYSDFDAWVNLNKELGIGDKIVLYSIATWSGTIRYYDESTSSYVTAAPTVGSDEWTAMWKDFLQKMINHLDDKGWFNETYMGIDERGFSTAVFDLVDSVTGRNAQPLKTAGAMDSFTTKADFAARVTDLSIGSTAAKANLDAFRQLVAQREAQGLKTTIYTCTEHFPNSEALSMPGESYWAMLFSASQGADGFMRWAYDAWVEDPLNDTTHWAYEAGDCFLVYPGDESNGYTTRSSVRLAKIAEGIRDVNKLKLMESEIPSLKSDIDALYDSINLNYTYYQNGVGEHGGMKLATDETKAQLPQDMQEIKDKIAEITEKYVLLKENGTNEVESVTIKDGDFTLTNGESRTLTISLLPENLLNTQVTFTSSNERVATVSESGVVTAYNKGTAKIKAVSKLDSSKYAEITVTVTGVEIEESAQVAYYSFNDISGNKITDEWNSYDGILTGGTVIDGVSGNALNFTSSDQINITAPAELSNDWSIAMWVKEDAVSETPVSVMWDGSEFTNASSQTGSMSLDMRMSNGKLGMHISEGYVSITDPASTGVWNHIVWVCDSQNGLCVYINGVRSGYNVWSTSHDVLAPLNVIAGRNFAGSLDEVKIFNRVLTQAEVNELRKLPGINVDADSQEITQGETFIITAELVADVENNSLVFESEDESVAVVDQNGRVTGVNYGDTYIVITNAESGYSTKVFVRVNKTLSLHSAIPEYEYPTENQIVVDREEGQYLGQPDLVMLDDERTIITVYPMNHGLGATLMRKSTDGGETWTERIIGTPTSWESSQETPTIYKLNFTDGSQKLIIITGCPGTWGDYTTGWNTSISDDEGETWTEYRHFYTGQPTIVAMASLIQLKDEDGNYIDKWMGVFHDGNYVNYKTYLTFDEDGNDQWSEPVPYLSEWRSVESSYQICEVGMFRSPDGSRIIALARSQSHLNLSTMFYSDDEGETWSKPRDISASLLGERHKAVYDPTTGQYFITFREIILDYNNDGAVTSGDWRAGEWYAWVGTYEQLMSGGDGNYRICLANDYTPTTYSGDTGYAGLCITEDGTIFTDSYGNFDPEDTSNKTFIIGVKFRLAEIEQAMSTGLGMPDGITLDSSSAVLKAGETLQLASTVTPSSLANTEVIWKSYDPSIATVDNGLVKAVSAGTVTIVATTGSTSAYCTVTVEWLSGDVDHSGVIDSADATLVLQKYAGIIDENTEGYDNSLADVNGDGSEDSGDATLILQKYAGIITAFKPDA